jgi:hypothetical protein
MIAAAVVRAIGALILVAAYFVGVASSALSWGVGSTRRAALGGAHRRRDPLCVCRRWALALQLYVIVTATSVGWTTVWCLALWAIDSQWRPPHAAASG